MRATAALPPWRGRLEDLRSTEFARLDQNGHTYLDYTGAALYGRSQIEAHHHRLCAGIFGNPHSENPTSKMTSASMQRARDRLLGFLHADAREYAVCFTPNASGALRLVGEAYPFDARSQLVITTDNHNSVHGIRCFAARAGAAVRYVPLTDDLRSADPVPVMADAPRGGRHLFAFPAQSNFTGVRHPLAWIEQAHQLGHHVLLDAAAFTASAPLRLDAVRPDFVCLSFYKMFGYPTGIGALVARREALAQLQRPWFAGGTVDFVSTQHAIQGMRSGVESFEDGTPHFLAFDAVCDGLDLLLDVGIERIAQHCASMTKRLLHGLGALRHSGERALVALYGPATLELRGGTVAFNVLDADGRVVPFADVVSRASGARISVRGGCFCNPGAAEAAFALPRARTAECLRRLEREFTVDRFANCLGRPVGAVRASVGLPTNVADIDRLLELLATFRISG